MFMSSLQINDTKRGMFGHQTFPRMHGDGTRYLLPQDTASSEESAIKFNLKF